MADIMNKKFDEIVNAKEKLENERIQFGGIIYKNRNLLPSLIITEDNFHKIIDDLNMIQKICNQSSQDIVRLHADLFCHYGFYDNHEKNQNSPIYAIINEMSIPIVAKLGIAKENADDLEKKINTDIIQKKKSTIYGEEYCFISIILNEIFPIYTGLVSFLLGRVYFDENYLEVIRQRLDFLMHPSYEALRKSFKVVEILRIISNPIDTVTVH